MRDPASALESSAAGTPANLIVTHDTVWPVYVPPPVGSGD